jgi:cell division protein FtsI/penicillin-binding protein 2
VGLVGLVLVGRLAQIQLLWRGRFGDSYRRSTAGDRTLETQRGGIYTRDGRTLARDAARFDLCLHYDHLEESDWIPAVSRLTGEPPEKLRGRADEILRRVQRIWRVVRENTGMENLRIAEQETHHTLVENVTPEVAVLVRTEPDRFPGMKIIPSARRLYPAGELAPHIVGRCAPLSPERWEKLQQAGRSWNASMGVAKIGSRYRQDDKIGVSCLERAYEGVLRGSRDYMQH